MADKLIVNRVINRVFLALSLGAIASFSSVNQVIAEDTIIPQSPVEPSLWWKTQRLQEGWVENIAINSDTRQAIITININRWLASDYLQRFSFLFKLGTEAQKQNFNVRLHNRRNQKIAEYSTQQVGWTIDPTSLGAAPFRVNAPAMFQQ